jgi:hypothetical protein
MTAPADGIRHFESRYSRFYHFVYNIHSRWLTELARRTENIF